VILGCSEASFLPEYGEIDTFRRQARSEQKWANDDLQHSKDACRRFVRDCQTLPLAIVGPHVSEKASAR